MQLRSLSRVCVSLGNDMIPKSCTFRTGSSKLPRSHVCGVPISFEWHKSSSSQQKYFGAAFAHLQASHPAASEMQQFRIHVALLLQYFSCLHRVSVAWVNIKKGKY